MPIKDVAKREAARAICARPSGIKLAICSGEPRGKHAPLWRKISVSCQGARAPLNQPALHSIGRELLSLYRSFSVKAGLFQPQQKLHAVSGVDIAVERSEVLGIVGESGCGKSTLARMLLGLTPPSAGMIYIEGQDIATLGRLELARRIQPVFQDPYSSLNPRRSVAAIVAFPLEVHGIGTRSERRGKAIEMLERVGLPARYADSTPGQLSGGQRRGSASRGRW